MNPRLIRQRKKVVSKSKISTLTQIGYAVVLQCGHKQIIVSPHESLKRCPKVVECASCPLVQSGFKWKPFMRRK